MMKSGVDKIDMTGKCLEADLSALENIWKSYVPLAKKKKIY